MTVASVVDAITAVLRDGVPELVTIEDALLREQKTVNPADCPALLFLERREVRRPLSHDEDEERWWLDCYVWAYYRSLQASIAGSRALIQSIKDVLAQSRTLNGAADTDTTALIAFGVQIEDARDRWVSSGTGMVIRSAVISASVWETIRRRRAP